MDSDLKDLPAKIRELHRWDDPDIGAHEQIDRAAQLAEQAVLAASERVRITLNEGPPIEPGLYFLDWFGSPQLVQVLSIKDAGPEVHFTTNGAVVTVAGRYWSKRIEVTT
jgi:hypothetical protein